MYIIFFILQYLKQLHIFNLQLKFYEKLLKYAFFYCENFSNNCNDYKKILKNNFYYLNTNSYTYYYKVIIILFHSILSQSQKSKSSSFISSNSLNSSVVKD